MAEPSRAQPTIWTSENSVRVEPGALKTGASIAMVYDRAVAQ